MAEKEDMIAGRLREDRIAALRQAFLAGVDADATAVRCASSEPHDHRKGEVEDAAVLPSRGTRGAP